MVTSWGQTTRACVYACACLGSQPLLVGAVPHYSGQVPFVPLGRSLSPLAWPPCVVVFRSARLRLHSQCPGCLPCPSSPCALVSAPWLSPLPRLVSTRGGRLRFLLRLRCWRIPWHGVPCVYEPGRPRSLWSSPAAAGCQWYLIPDQLLDARLSLQRRAWPLGSGVLVAACASAFVVPRRCRLLLLFVCLVAGCCCCGAGAARPWHKVRLALLHQVNDMGPLGMPVADAKHTFGFSASSGGWCAAPCGWSSEVAAALLLCSPVVPCLPNSASSTVVAGCCGCGVVDRCCSPGCLHSGGCLVAAGLWVVWACLAAA